MYEYDPSRSRVLRALTWSFPVGRAFGVQVRLHWTAGLLLLYAVYETGKFTSGFAEAAALGAIWTVGLYLVVWTHEMGHVLAARRWHVRTSRISLSVLGGLAHLQEGMPSPKAEAVVSLAGPAVHLAWLALLWPATLATSVVEATGSGWFYDPLGYAVWVLWRTNLWLMVFNLLPFLPMDGGRVLRALLARRMHPNRATLWAARVGILGAVGIAAFGLTRPGLAGSILVLIAVNNVLACLREMRLARWSDGPYGEPRDPWEGDPDAWKVGAVEEERPTRKRGGLRLLSRRASPRPPDVLVRAGADDEADLDRLLEKVGRVGLSGLTDVERATLQRISESRKRLR